jgi:hypothetical protein
MSAIENFIGSETVKRHHTTMGNRESGVNRVDFGRHK